jgi:hypothetical protein
VGAYFKEKLQAFRREPRSVVEVRGKGLMLGVEFKEPVAPLLSNLLDAGIICGPPGPTWCAFCRRSSSPRNTLIGSCPYCRHALESSDGKGLHLTARFHAG